jgi:hypothetical protein
MSAEFISILIHRHDVKKIWRFPHGLIYLFLFFKLILPFFIPALVIRAPNGIFILDRHFFALFLYQ